MPQRSLLQIGGLSFQSDITKWLIVMGVITFSLPVIWWCSHKGKAKLHAIQKERRQRKREALESGAAPDWGGEGSDSDKSEDWDIEKVLGEKVPIPRWAREDAERAAAAGATAGAEGAATGRGANTNRSGGHTGRETARSGAGAQTARTAGTGATGRVAQGGGTATVGAGSTRRDSILSEVTGR